ncbi:MAG: hypothetical protein AB8H12_12960, partial [Lewinella sp.]
GRRADRMSDGLDERRIGRDDRPRTYTPTARRERSNALQPPLHPRPRPKEREEELRMLPITPLLNVDS